MIIARKIESADRWAIVGAGQEVQVLAAGIKGYVAAIAHSVSHLLRLAALNGVDIDGMHVVRKRLRICDPPAVGRPPLLNSSSAILAVVDLHRLTCSQIDVPQVIDL